MSILDEQLINRLKTIDRWLPRVESRPAVSSLGRPRRRPAPSSSGDAGLPLVGAGQLTLTEAIANLSSAPDHAALLGVCEDGLPFLLDLANPAPGAILLVGDLASGKTPLLLSLLVSASRMNPVEKVNFSVIASQPDEYFSLGEADHCQEIFPVEDPAIGDLIAGLVRTIESRKRTGPQDPAQVLVIDDLAALLPFLDEQSFSSLYWLIRHGPRYQVWTIAALPAGQVSQVEPRFLTAFRTRLFGYMRDERLACRLANDDHLAARDLEKGRQFYVPYDGDWLRFWICEPEDHQDDGLDSEENGGPE